MRWAIVLPARNALFMLETSFAAGVVRRAATQKSRALLPTHRWLSPKPKASRTLPTSRSIARRRVSRATTATAGRGRDRPR